MGGGGDTRIKETEEQKALATVAMQRWQDYQEKFRPYEDKFMRKVDSLNSERSYNQVANMASAEVGNQFSEAINQSAVQLGASGVNPNSGLFKRELSKLEQQKAKAQVDTVNQGQVSQQDRYTQGLGNIVAMGQGKSGEAMAGLGDIASNANRYAVNAAQNRFQNNQDTQTAVGGVAGAGARYGLNYLEKDGG